MYQGTLRSCHFIFNSSNKPSAILNLTHYFPENLFNIIFCHKPQPNLSHRTQIFTEHLFRKYNHVHSQLKEDKPHGKPASLQVKLLC